MNEREIATATRLITAKGRDISLVTVTPSGDAWNPTNTESSQTVKAVQTAFNNAEIASGLVELTDVKYLIDSVVEPTTSMRIVDNSKTYSVKSVMPIKPGESVILYKVVAGG